MRKKLQISGILFFISFLMLTFYLSVSLDSENVISINSIEVLGAVHLSAGEYLEYSKLDNNLEYQNLNLNIINDRIIKHPYVKNAEVRYDGDGKVFVRIFEKSFNAMIYKNQNIYLITDYYQLVPFLKNTRDADYPVLNRPLIKNELKEFETINSDDVKISFKMILAIKLLNPELLSELSEIDLRNGKDILIYFSGLEYPVVIGRGNEVTKIVYLNKLLSYLKGKELNNYLSYLDLRYGNNIYLGLTDELMDS